MHRLTVTTAMWSLCFTCAICFGETSAAGQAKSGDDITLLKADGKKVLVPSTGQLANARAQEIAQEIVAFDKQAASRPARERASDPAVAEAVSRVSRELRDDTVDKLDLIYRVAETTSGPLDTALLQAARNSADLLKQIMSAPPPPRASVHTEVTTSIQNAVIGYCLRGDYKRHACSWKSYSPGDLMPIGLYVFRVEVAPDNDQAREEEVLVLNDPTKRTIRPMR